LTKFRKYLCRHRRRNKHCLKETCHYRKCF